MMSLCSIVFFFKQKTAYEMRISDWSSDVCSSDLPEMFDRLDGFDQRQLVRRQLALIIGIAEAAFLRAREGGGRGEAGAPIVGVVAPPDGVIGLVRGIGIGRFGARVLVAKLTKLTRWRGCEGDPPGGLGARWEERRVGKECVSKG